MKRNSFLIIFLCLLMLLGSTIVNAKTYTLKVGSIESVGGVQYQTMQWVKEQIIKRTNGQIKLDYYPASQLGSTTEEMDSVAAGTIDIMVIGCNLMGRMGKYWIIDSLPFVFKDEEHRKAFNSSDLNEIRKKQILETHGIRIIAQNWYRTPHVLITAKPVRMVEDVKGLKMRVPEARGQYIGWKELGMQPATISWGEVYLALKQGVVDGVSSAFELIPEMKFHEVAPYITMLNTERSYDNVMMNNNSYMNLPENLRDILDEVFNEAGQIYEKMSWDKYYEILQTLPKEGAQILFLDTSPFREKVMANLPEKLDKEGLLEKEMWEKIQSLAK